MEDKGADVLVAPAADANVAVLVFTGASDQMSMPLPIFDRYLATLGVTAIYLKDFERVMYLSGIRSLGKSYDSTAEALRDILGRLGATRLCAMGSSDGGYAAIRYGITLGADRITSFDGPTHSAPEFDEFAVLTTRVAARYSREEVDLKTFLSGQAYSSQISLWYGQGSGRDKVHALHLRDCNGVTLHPVAGVSTHNVLRGLALNHDDLLPTLHGLLGLTIET